MVDTLPILAVCCPFCCGWYSVASKKYKDMSCVYCTQATSTTADHVIARSFFPKSGRTGIPKVPSCNACNSEKSMLETYLSAFLAIGSDDITAQTVVLQDIEKRLNRNRRLARELNFMAAIRWEESENGLVLPALELPVNEKYVEGLFAFIARGLIWHHFSQLITDEFFIKTAALTENAESNFKKKFFPNTDGCVWDDICDGGFQYVGKQSGEYPQLTMWLMRFYSGVMFAEKNGDQVSRCFIAFTGRKEILESAELKARFGITS